MRKPLFIIVLLLIVTPFVKAATFTSTSNGNYESSSTWSVVGADPDGIPDNNDVVIIAGGTTVTLGMNCNAMNLTTNIGGVLNLNGKSMLVWGNLTNNGSTSGTGSWHFRSPGTFTGNPIFNNGTYYFYASYTIAAGAGFTKGGAIVVSSNITVTNMGSVNLTNSTLSFSSSTSTWINGAGSSLSVAQNITGSGTLNASAATNTVTYSSNNSTTIYTGGTTSYYNLTLASTSANTKALSNSVTVRNNLRINNAVTLNFANMNLTLGGNWINSANTTCLNEALITFNGSGTQTITRSTPEVFKNVTLAGTGTVKCNTGLTINGTANLNAGTLDPDIYTIHIKGANFNGNGGLCNVAASGLIQFDRVGAQTLGGTTGTIFGNVQFNNGASITLSVNNGSAGITTLQTGTFDVGPFNWTQSGAFFLLNGMTINTAAAGAIVFTGASAQQINGSSPVSFGNVTVASTSTLSTSFDLTILGTINLNSGTIDPSTFTIHAQGANFNGNGGLVNTGAAGMFQFDGVVPQTLGGTSGTVFGNVNFNNGSTITLTITNGGAGTTTLSSGTLDIGAFNWNQSGASFTMNGMTINTAAAGAIVFTGSSPQLIDGSSPVSFGNITINSSSTVSPSFDLDIAKNYTLTSGTYDATASSFGLNISGNFVHNGGVFNAQQSLVIFQGSSAQTISGAAATNFYDILSSNSSGGVTVSSGLAVITDILKINSQSFGTSGAGTIELLATSATQAAQIDAMPTGTSLVGTGWIVQAYINGPATGYWQYLGSPINATTLADWDNDPRFYMSGVGGNDGNACCPIFYSVRTYSTASNSYTNIMTTSTSLIPGKGFMVWMSDNMSQLTSPLIFDSRGKPSFGVVTRAVTAGGAGAGYNLVANPYACPIDFPTVVATSGNLGPNFSILQENGTYVVNPNGGVIAGTQGFMCVATSSGNMTFDEGCKATGTTPNIIRTASESNFVRIRTSNDVNGLGGETSIQFNSMAHNGFDLGPDMAYLPSPYDGATNLWTTDADNEDLLCNSLDSRSDALDIILSVQVNVSGRQSISFSGIDRITDYSCAWLEDPDNGTKINLGQTDNYSFDGEMGDVHKFILHFERTGDCTLDEQAISTTLESASQVYVSADQLKANFFFNETTNVQVNIYDAEGREVAAPEFFSVSNGSVNLTNPGAHGVYFVQIIKGDDVVTKKIFY